MLPARSRQPHCMASGWAGRIASRHPLPWWIAALALIAMRLMCYNPLSRKATWRLAEASNTFEKYDFIGLQGTTATGTGLSLHKKYSEESSKQIYQMPKQLAGRGGELNTKSHDLYKTQTNDHVRRNLGLARTTTETRRLAWLKKMLVEPLVHGHTLAAFWGKPVAMNTTRSSQRAN